MRHARVKIEGAACYHVVSRIVDRNFRLDDAEKEIFRKMMRKAEAFSGVHVLTYAVMSSHFHLLVEVSERGDVDEAELLRRMTALYGAAHVRILAKQWTEWRGQGSAYLVEDQQNRLRLRMGGYQRFRQDTEAAIQHVVQRSAQAFGYAVGGALQKCPSRER